MDDFLDPDAAGHGSLSRTEGVWADNAEGQSARVEGLSMPGEPASFKTTTMVLDFIGFEILRTSMYVEVQSRPASISGVDQVASRGRASRRYRPQCCGNRWNLASILKKE